MRLYGGVRVMLSTSIEDNHDIDMIYLWNIDIILILQLYNVVEIIQFFCRLVATDSLCLPHTNLSKKETKHTINTDYFDRYLFCFQIFNRYWNDTVITNSFGHDNHMVKIWYCDSPTGEVSAARYTNHVAPQPGTTIKVKSQANNAGLC